MIGMKVWVLSSFVSLFGVADTGDAQLAILVSQTAQQIAEIEKLLKTANMTSKEVSRARELAEKLQEGIDTALTPYKKSRRYMKAVMELRENGSLRDWRRSAEDARGYFDEFREVFPEEAKKDEERLKEHESFQTEVRNANRSDLEDIESFESHLDTAKPGEVSKLSVQAQLKSWESQVLLREQLSRLLEENKGLREELKSTRRKEKLAAAEGRQAVSESWNNRWEPGFYDRGF